MRRRILLALGVIGLSLGAYGAPASADLSNPYAFWACGATRQTEEHVVVSATPINIGVYSNGVAWIRASCISEADNWGIVCSWIAESRSNGQNFIWNNSAHCVIT